MRDYVPVTLTECSKCGDLFKIKVCHLLIGRGKYCSIECSGKSKIGKEHKPFNERFFDKVTKTKGCWEWNATRLPRGYGSFTNQTTKTRLAHRISYIIHNGPIPDRLLVLHHCDNPPCVKPDHLWIGTHKDNMADMYKKGREPLQNKVIK